MATRNTAGKLANLSRWPWPSPKRLRPRIRCSAWLTDRSRQCRQWAIHGGSVCWHHGGAAPQVQAAAQLRVMQAEAERYLAKAAVQSARRQQRQIEHAAKVIGCEPSEINPHIDLFAAAVIEEFEKPNEKS
jgi:hypothetical protein